MSKALPYWEQRTLATPMDFAYSRDVLVYGTVRNTEDGTGVIATGLRDWANPHSAPIDGDTMMPEASIGKPRYVGLAYMMQQEGMLDLQANAKALFQSAGMKTFLDAKYPGKNMQAEILKLFPGKDSERIKLIDFTTHCAGMGDLRMQEISRDGKGIVGGYTLPETLAVPRDKRPPARGPMMGDNFKEEIGTYGQYQYSNVGYMLFAEAMEVAYVANTGTYKNYRQLLKDFMLQPVEGPAVGKVNFTHTKFYQDLDSEDNVAITHWADNSQGEKGKIIKSNAFNGHLGSVGPLASHNDTVAFFTEFFRGFPGTKEHGKGTNLFFTDATIELMRQEWEKPRDVPGHSIEKGPALPEYFRPDTATRSYHPGPGFIIEKDKKTGEIVSYFKGGIMFGCHKNVEFLPKMGIVRAVARATENVTSDLAQMAGIKPVQAVMAAYTDKDGQYQRDVLLQDYKERSIAAVNERVDTSYAAEIVIQKSRQIRAKL